MECRTAKETRCAAWNALAQDSQYLKFVLAGMLLSLTVSAIAIPLVSMLVAGIAASGIAPFFAPGGSPELGILADPGIMLPLLVSVTLFSVLVLYPVGFGSWGMAAMSLAAARRGIRVGHAFSGFGHGWRMGWIEAVKGTYLFLWSMLFLIPGIVKGFSYSMTQFVAVDHPDWSANRCISESRRLMHGHKWRYFCMILGFWGWFVLVSVASLFPFGGLAQWLFVPYFQTALASFYEELLDADAGASPAVV